MDQKGVFSSFELALGAGNAYMSWIGNQGPFSWEKIHEYNWTFQIDENYSFMIHKQKVDARWWQNG